MYACEIALYCVYERALQDLQYIILLHHVILQVLVECARLCGVGRILNEPGNLWWGKLPTIQGVHGLILPSQFAADFWQQQIRGPSHGTSVPLAAASTSDVGSNGLNVDKQGQPLDYTHFDSMRYLVINPGVDIPLRMRTSSHRGQSDVTPSSQDAVLVIGWFGRAEPQKSPGLALHLAAALKNQSQQQQQTPSSPVARTCLLVAGGGSLVGSSGSDSPLAEMATGLGLKVGRCPLRAFDLAQRDVFAMPKEANEDNGHHFSGSSFDGSENGDSDWADVEFTGPLSHTAMLRALHTRVDVLVHTNVLEETFCMVMRTLNYTFLLSTCLHSNLHDYIITSKRFYLLQFTSLSCIHN